MITLLDQNTINKIAAGEVIERPSAVVKELVENAIDAGANAVTVEIKEGGISFIRITDNGCGLERGEIQLAFKRHSTSKIKSVEDLMTVKSLGFRGEALSSIASVSQAELITKTAGALTGSRYVIEGSEEKEIEEIGCPDGTTFLIRNLFYNTPARRKFLKSSMTEAGYVGELVERLAISHPDISFKFISNNQVKLQTSGNRNIKDIIYHVYGRDIAAQILPVNKEKGTLKIEGYIGKPLISRGNRNYMNYFINGRYIKNNIINRAIEEAYKPYTMAHRYPFTVLCFTIDSALLDINVHPAKMEVRFSNQEEVFNLTYDALSESLKEKELIPEVSLLTPAKKEKAPQKKAAPEPFERKRMEEMVREENSYRTSLDDKKTLTGKDSIIGKEAQIEKELQKEALPAMQKMPLEQMELFPETNEKLGKENGFLKKENVKEHRIIGQLFSTYWLIEYQDKLFLIDQHAAHEKVLFERMMHSLSKQEFASQLLNPPIVLTLNLREEEVVKKHQETFCQLGFEIEPFGGKEYCVRAVPANLCTIAQKDLLLEMIDAFLREEGKLSSDLLLEKVASMACKAAVKGNTHLSEREAHELIDELMTLENPYHCPHGRPTIVSMSKYEIEKKFKRIL